LFEKSGVLRDSEDDTSVIATMNAELYSKLKKSDPFRNDSKLDNFNSLSRGVQKNTNSHHSMLQNDDAICTTIEL
jgi:acetylglutamate kinase